MKPIGDRPLPLAVQAGLLRQAFEQSSVKLSSARLVWTGTLTPSPQSRSYVVRLECRPSLTRPKVTVLSPELEKRDGRLPHVFPGDELCLHMPGEWNGTMRLADTIVPWAAEWLLHYELWLVDGIWSGGGHEPSDD